MTDASRHAAAAVQRSPPFSEAMLLRAIVLDANAYLGHKDALKLLRGSSVKASGAQEAAWYRSRERCLEAQMAKSPIAAVKPVGARAGELPLPILSRERLMRTRYDTVGNQLWLLVPGLTLLAARVSVVASLRNGDIIVEYSSPCSGSDGRELYTLELSSSMKSEILATLPGRAAGVTAGTAAGAEASKSGLALSPLDVYVPVTVFVPNVMNTDAGSPMKLSVLARPTSVVVALSDIQAHVGPMFSVYRSENDSGEHVWHAAYKAGGIDKTFAEPLKLTEEAVDRVQSRIIEIEEDDDAITFVVA
jgi:hypothetical protein